MTLESWVRFGHILSAMVWVGGGMALSFVASRARSDDDPGAVREFGRTLTYVGPDLVAP
jgi:putative copper export protein